MVMTTLLRVCCAIVPIEGKGERKDFSGEYLCNKDICIRNLYPQLKSQRAFQKEAVSSRRRVVWLLVALRSTEGDLW